MSDVQEIQDNIDVVNDAIAEMTAALDVINSVEITVRTPNKEVTLDYTKETKQAILGLVIDDLSTRNIDLFSEAQRLMK